MEVKPGYRQTEVGVIPGDWNPTTIGQFAIKVGSGITPRGGRRNYKEYGRPFVRSQNVSWGTLLLDDLVYITDETHKSFASTELRVGDVLLNITGASIGRCAIADTRLEGGNVNQHVCIIRTELDKVSSRFVSFLLLSSVGQKQIDSFQAGGNREGLNFSQIRSIKIPLPPTRDEQEKIAETLTDAGILIEHLEQLIAKRRNLKQGTMQELLTGKKRLPEFITSSIYKQTEAGLIPAEWDLRRIGDFTTTVASGTSHADAEFGDYPVYGSTGIIGRSTKNDYSGRALLIARVGANAGRLTVVDGDYGVTDNTIIVRTDQSLDPDYFWRQLDVKHLNSMIFGSGQPLITGTQIKNLCIPVPDKKAEQVAIATVLSDMDADIAALEAKVSKARLLKQGMMQELLTGRIRLV